MEGNMEGNRQLVLATQFLATEKPIIAVPGTISYKRTFPFDAVSGELNVGAPSSEEEVLLQRHVAAFRGLKLLRGHWQEQLPGGMAESSGTFFPLAAPAGAEAVWCSAGHCLLRRAQLRWRCGYGQEVPSDPHRSQPVGRHVVDLSWVKDPLSPSQLAEAAPSEPARVLPDALVMPDFGFMITDSQAVQPPPRQLFIPCAEALPAGRPVCVLGFADKADPLWAQTFLRTEADYQEVLQQHQSEHHRDPPASWQLDARVAFQRVTDLYFTALHPYRLAAAPGRVFAATDRIVEHTCSTFPGMSGAPGVDIQTPWKLLFVCTRADSDWRRNSNNGRSVNHPLFVRAYVREVLPKLLATPLDWLEPGMLQCLHQYLVAHADSLEDPSMLARVAELAQRASQ